MADVYCNSCGHRNAIGANFCSSCGAVLDPGEHDHTTIVFHANRPADAPDDELTVDLEAVPAEVGMLVVKRGPKAGSRFALDEPVITAGRHPESNIFLDDITVSRRHAEITREGGGYRVRDVGSLNGTYLNRERIEDAELHNGDELQVGKFRLVFFLRAPSE